MSFFDISIWLIFILVCFYFLFLLYFIYLLNNKSGTGPLFERSGVILLMANSSNLIETICNILSGYFLSKNDDNLDYFQLFTILPAVYATRLYSSCIILRVKRIIILFKIRNSEYKEKTLNKWNSIVWIFLIANVYPLLVACCYVLLWYKKRIDKFWISGFDELLYSAETLVFVFFCWKLWKIGTHPTIFVEYLFYSLVWSLSIYDSQKFYQERWLYSIPIRNLILLMISAVSMAEHCENTKAPLPIEIEFQHIFEIGELYYDFFAFLQAKNEIELVEACNLYKEWSKAVYTSNYKTFYESPCLSKFINHSITEPRDYLEFLLNESAEAYFLSDRFLAFRKNYFISCN